MRSSISTDMLAYGGLIASRVPGPSYSDAYFRLRELAHLRERSPRAWIGAFGTIMRLAPTGIPAGTPFFAPYPVWSYLQEYANLHDPPLPSETARAAQLRELDRPGDARRVSRDARARSRRRSLCCSSSRAQGRSIGSCSGRTTRARSACTFPTSRCCKAELAAASLEGRVSIEPGADELGTALVAHALARAAEWHAANRRSLLDARRGRSIKIRSSTRRSRRRSTR